MDESSDSGESVDPSLSDEGGGVSGVSESDLDLGIGGLDDDPEEEVEEPARGPGGEQPHAQNRGRTEQPQQGGGRVDHRDRTALAAAHLADDPSEVDESAFTDRDPNTATGGQDGVVPFEPTIEDDEQAEAEADTGPEPNLEDLEDDGEGGLGLERSSGDEAVEKLGEERQYIEITPVRSTPSATRLVKELRAFHSLGNGRAAVLGLEEKIPWMESLSTFEFLIHKPEGRQEFSFYLGIDPEEDLDHIESKVASQYPTNYQFTSERLDLAELFEETPHICRWNAREKLRNDWMTLLSRFGEEDVERSPLSGLLETAIKSDEEWVFQVLFEPKPDWEAKGERRKQFRKRGANSMPGMMAQDFLDRLLGVSEHEERRRHQDNVPVDTIGGAAQASDQDARFSGSRMEHIDYKGNDKTFDVNVRVATADEQIAKESTSELTQLSGPYYEIEGRHLGQDEDEWQMMVQRELSRSVPLFPPWRKKPSLVANPEELANFITVPSIDSLPQAARGASGGAPDAQAPLTAPNEEILETYDDGMSIGKVVSSIDRDRREAFDDPIDSVREWKQTLADRESIHLDATDLTNHTLRAATTGHGKTVATINDMLSTYSELDGPTFLLDSSGGDMCENYLRAHRYIHGDTEDVEYIKIPEEDEELPGIPFFDIRPLIHNTDRPRETAIQDKIDHYYEVMRYLMDPDALDRAFVANQILKGLIETMFAEERTEFPDKGEGEYGETEKNGGDAFGITDLYRTALLFDNYGDEEIAIPDHAPHDTEAVLRRTFKKSETAFQNTVDAVLNRVEKVQERSFIWRMLDYKPEWDDQRGWYPEDESVFDFRDLFNSNKVVLIDTGDLRDKPSNMFSVLFLSHLWTALRSLHTPSNDDWVCNCFIEESAPLARSSLVHETLLPEGRKFGLSMNMIMQFPEQVLGDDPHGNQGAYNEVLNQIDTKIIGEIEVDDKLAESLFHDDLAPHEVKSIVSGLPKGQWVVQLPNAKFGQQRPEILTLNSLPLPPGHSESSETIRPMTKSVRERSRKQYCVGPDDLQQCDLPLVDSVLDESDEGTAAVADGTGAADVDEDGERSAEELTRQEQTFLQDVVNYWNRDLSFYDRGYPMDNQQFDRRNCAPALIRDGFLEPVEFLNRYTYYWPTDKALSEFDELHIAQGWGVGDPNESPRHKIMVSLLEHSYEEQGFNVSVYTNPDGFDQDRPVFDLIARHPDPSIDTRVIEVECAIHEQRGVNPKDEMLDDYKKMAQFGSDNSATAVWVVENQDVAQRLFDVLSDADVIENTLPDRVRKYSEMTKRADLNSGVDKITGFSIVAEETISDGSVERLSPQ